MNDRPNYRCLVSFAVETCIFRDFSDNVFDFFTVIEVLIFSY
jgi:hypothetical protein